LSFSIEKHLIGPAPSVHHTTNIILHLICTFLSYRLAKLLGFPVWGAAAVALIFGLHPMKVESVAWITERKDVLYSAFYLGAMINYVKWVRDGKKRKYVIYIIILFALSLLSKIQAVALPLSMLCIDYLLKRPLKWKLLFEKWFYFLMSLATGLLGIYFLQEQGSLGSTSTYNFFDRIFIGMYSYSVYIVKFFVPFRISPLYPYPADIPWIAYVSPAFVAGTLALCWVAFKRKWRHALFGIAFFTVNIVFLLQVVGAGQAFLADRFVYIPYLGLTIAAVYYMTQLIQHRPKLKPVAIGVTAAWIAAMAVLTWTHVPVWKNSGTLWTHVIKYYDKTALPFRNRAQYYRENGQTDLALQDYARSIALEKDPDVINSRARLNFERQNWAEALKDYNLAIELDPDVGEYYINRGAVFAMQRDYRAALSDMTKGVELDPNFENGYKNRSLVYQALGQIGQAQQDLQTYLSLNPYDATIWYESGRLYRMQNDNPNALKALTRAIQLDPRRGLYYLERARVNAVLGQKPQARSDLANAERLGAEIDSQTRAAVQ
jgi:tetratricopeptide (TPR) repeat protein